MPEKGKSYYNIQKLHFVKYNIHMFYMDCVKKCSSKADYLKIAMLGDIVIKISQMVYTMFCRVECL